MKRTAVLVAALSAVVAAASLPAVAAPDGPDRVRVVHLVVDGLHPAQVGPHTPTLAALRADGTWYEQARAVMAAETLPNHVAMATGTYPAFNGIPGNTGRVAVGDTDEEDLGRPELLRADSVTRTIERTCPDLHTVTVFSKSYVHRIFAEDGADRDFPQERFNIPYSGHALDATTVAYIQQQLVEQAPDYLFANLGDVDRAGHIDATGASGVAAEQLAALEQTDALVGSVVDELRRQGLWEETVLVVSSDHSMDWVVAVDRSAAVDLAALLEADAATAGRFFVSENGGAGLVYLRDPAAPDADEALRAARAVLLDHPGVHEALYREANPLDPGHDLATVHPDWHLADPRAGELFVTVRPGYKVGSPTGNPLPGNHGHPVTRHSTMLVTGGWDGLAAPRSVAPSDPGAVDTVTYDDTRALPEQAESVDVAPTVGWLLGVPDPGRATAPRRPQWRGRVLSEAFDRRPAPVCVAAAPGPPAPTPPPAAGGNPAPPLPTTGGGLAGAGLLLAAAVALHGRRPRHR